MIKPILTRSIRVQDNLLNYLSAVQLSAYIRIIKLLAATEMSAVEMKDTIYSICCRLFCFCR